MRRWLPLQRQDNIPVRVVRSEPEVGNPLGACRHGHAHTPLRGDHGRVCEAGGAKHCPHENAARAKLAVAPRTDAHAFRRIDTAIRDPALPGGKGLQGVLSVAPLDGCRMNIEGSCNFADRVSVINQLAGRSLLKFCAQLFGVRPPVRPGASRSPRAGQKPVEFFGGMW